MKIRLTLYSIFVLLLSFSSLSKMTEQEWGYYIKSLTPVGAEKQGNTDGSIPAWTGGITEPPQGYNIGQHHVDPFSDDPLLVEIDFQNKGKFRNILTPGIVELINTYQTYKLQVYPTRRSASYPQYVYEASFANALKATMTEEGEGLKNATIGVPFPIPDNGMEVMWNHITRYRGQQVRRYIHQAVVTADHKIKYSYLPDQFHMDYSLPTATTEDLELHNILFQFKQNYSTPVKTERSALLVKETLNQIKQPRQAWSFIEANFRVQRDPSVGYDGVSIASEGLRRVDEFDMFNGALDKFEWQLLGKKEVLIPYNNYKLHSDELTYENILHRGHINPEYVRWEKHRVWVVQATRRSISDHIYKRRVYYLDEDSWQIHLVDVFDHHNELIRVGIGYTINYYDVPALWTTLEVFHDLKHERYVAFGLDNQSKMYDFISKHNPQEYTPSSLRRLN